MICQLGHWVFCSRVQREVWARDINCVAFIVYTGLKRIWTDEIKEQSRILENVHIGC